MTTTTKFKSSFTGGAPNQHLQRYFPNWNTTHHKALFTRADSTATDFSLAVWQCTGFNGSVHTDGVLHSAATAEIIDRLHC